jgi:hypothetical protein
MKKYLSIIPATLLLTAILFSCKKSSTPVPKDYAASIKDKTWSGEITYTNDSTQYYSVQFNADKTLVWSQFLGDYPGSWGIDGKQITMTFNGSNVIIRADIGDDDKFSNIIVSNTNAYVINSGGLIVNLPVQLEGTVWNGSGFYAVATYPLQMTFLPGSKVEVKINGFVKPLTTYTRSASGAFIRFNSNIGGTKNFGVLISPTQMKGSTGATSLPWRVAKQ